jgi:hypothetical protein
MRLPSPIQEHKRRTILPLIGLVLVGCYLVVFQPLKKRAEDLDEPLRTSWKQLAASLGRTNTYALDFEQITAQLEETRQSLATLSSAERKIVSRLEAGPSLRARLSEPFRLVDYQNELSKHIDEVTQQSKLRQITIDPVFYEGFPQHRIEITEPNLLWGALRMTEDLVDSAIQCNITAMHYLEVPAAFTNVLSATNPLPRWAEVPIFFEFTSSSAAAARLLQCLPARAGELKPAGLPETSAEKGVLYIDRLLVKRQAPEKADEVRVWLKAVGFIMRE